MNHEHVGPEDYACDGCIREAAGVRAEKRREVSGVLLLVALVIAGLVLLSWYLG